MEPVFVQLGFALLLGLLVGLQREHAESGAAGLRTFPLITVLGTAAAMLGQTFGGWIVAAGLLGIVALIGVSHWLAFRHEDTTRGTTTDAAMLLMYCVGALIIIGPLAAAIVIGGATAILLQFKPELHHIARRLGDADLKAIMQFVLITCIILPVLPNKTYGPFDVLNPYETWLMVVLIVGMSLGGYIAYKFFGRDAGILLGGVLGGAISSTATTVSYARLSKGTVATVASSSVVIMLASVVVYVRVLFEITVVAPEFLRTAALPVLVMMLLTLVPALVLWLRARRHRTETPEPENPTQLKSALLFGLMYAVVLFALAAAESFAGDQGLYAVAGLSGLTDMDAITLSTARMVRSDPLVAADGWRLIVVAAMANMVFKAGIAGVLGGWRLLVRIALLFAIPIAGGVVLLWVGHPVW